MNFFSYIMMIMFFFLMMNSSSIYSQWLLMEFSTILMISMINIKSMNKIVSILYFMISTISSVFVIMAISTNFTQLFIINDSYLNMILYISLFMKIGIFPFISWMIYIYNMSSWNQIFIISTFMKFIPIYFFSSLIFMSSNFMLLLVLNNMFIALYTNINFSLKKLFGCSSIFNSLFFIMIMCLNKNYFILFMMIYLLVFWMLMIMLDFYNINNLNFNHLPMNSFKIMKILMFIYSSFPMFMSFIFKWQLTYLMTLNFSNNLMIALLVMSMFMMWNYFILFKYLITKFKYTKFPDKKKPKIFNYTMLFLITYYSTMFLLFNFI